MNRFARIVDAHLRGCLPPGVPPSYREIVGARRLNGKVIAADLIMFDGESAVVTLTNGWTGLSHRFHMPSAVYWERGRWNREAVTHPDLFPSPHRPLQDRDANHG